MFPLPNAPETPNIRALASMTREELTGLTTTAVTLAAEPRSGTERVFKNGSLVRPSTYSIAGKVITLASAAVAGDWFLIEYAARTT